MEPDKVSTKLSHRISFLNERDIWKVLIELDVASDLYRKHFSLLVTLNMRNHIMPFYQNIA